MRNKAVIVLGVSFGLTLLFALSWFIGFFLAPQVVGSLIHLLVILSLFTSFGVIVGLILVIVSYASK